MRVIWRHAVASNAVPAIAMPSKITLSGSYPRRETLVKATWDFDKGLLPAARLRAEFVDAAKELLTVERRAGIAAPTDGNLTWQDAFRGLVEGVPGFEVGGVTRLFETNRFYRQPILTGKPTFRPETLRQSFLLEDLAVKGPKKAILPSPYWFAHAAKAQTGNGASSAPETLARYLNQVATWLQGLGYTEIQLNEPLLFYQKDPDLRQAATLIETALRGVTAATIVNFPNGNAVGRLEWATRLPATYVGIDFVETHADEVETVGPPLRLVASVVDSQESLVEDPSHVAETVATIQRRLKPKELALAPTWDLQFLPSTAAEKKLDLLAAVTTKAVVA